MLYHRKHPLLCSVYPYTITFYDFMFSSLRGIHIGKRWAFTSRKHNTYTYVGYCVLWSVLLYTYFYDHWKGLFTFLNTYMQPSIIIKDFVQ